MCSHHVRWMIRRDMAEVLSLSPDITEQDILQELSQRNVIGMVVECDEKVIGYMLYKVHKNRLDVLYISAISPEVYVSLCNKLFSKLSSHRRRFVTFHAPLTFDNLPFLALLRDFGCTSAIEKDDIVSLVYSIPKEKPAPEELVDIVEILPE